jgi:hypothetical protein
MRSQLLMQGSGLKNDIDIFLNPDRFYDYIRTFYLHKKELKP